MKVLLLVCSLVVLAAAAKLKKHNVAQPHKEGLIEKRRLSEGSCGPHEVQCNDGRCIQNEWVCDTNIDCYDGADEANCPANCSGEHMVKCHNGGCIALEYRCDGDNDCGDNTDELNCHNHTCSPGEVQCDNYICIEEDYLCDDEDDCKNRWDEKNCVSSCRPDEFQCSDGSKCIDSDALCDHELDCYDKSDELQNCPCEEGGFLCDNGLCIPDEYRCDKDNDCGDASDEIHCATIRPDLCSNMLSPHECAVRNKTSTPICLDHANGFKFCRRFCNLCTHT